MKHTDNNMVKPPKKGAIGRVIKTLFADYKKPLFAVIVCIILTAIAQNIGIFMVKGNSLV